MLDTDNPISRLQSPSVRAALITIIINVLTLVAVFTGKTFDIEAVKAALDTWLPIAISLVSAWGGWQSYKGRINATKTIEPLPWKEEIKTLTQKEK